MATCFQFVENYCRSACASNSSFSYCMNSCVSSVSSPCNSAPFSSASFGADTVFVSVSDTVFVFPDSCGIAGGSGFALSQSAIDSLNMFFLGGFNGGIVFALPYLGAVVFVLLACFLLVSAYKNS